MTLFICLGLVELRLDDNNIASHVRQLAGTMAQCQPLLRVLSLRSNNLPDSSALAVAQLLLPSAACKLADLNISGNPSIAGQTCHKLAQSLSYTSSLQVLNLARARLGACPVALASKRVSDCSHPLLNHTSA